MSIELSSLVGSVVKTCLGGVIGWVTGLSRWLSHRRDLQTLMFSGRRFRFVFNPYDQQVKFLTFLPDGHIGEGNNCNEDRWRLRRGKLEIIASDGDVYSRFVFDKKMGRLVNTNDRDTRSSHGQYIEPLYIRRK